MLAIKQVIGMGPFSFLQNYGATTVELTVRGDNYAAYLGESTDQHGNVELIDMDVTIYNDEIEMPDAVSVRELVQIADSCSAILQTVRGEEFRGEVSAKIIKYPALDFRHRAFQVINGGLEGPQNRGVEVRPEKTAD